MEKSKINVAVILAMLVMLSACNGQESTAAKAKSQPEQTGQMAYEDLNSDEFESAIEATQDRIVLDVRTDMELEKSGKIPGAVQLDFFGDDFANEVAKLDRNTPVYVYCHSGGRSAQAAEQMKEMGFAYVYNLADGYGRWMSAGKPMEK